jgi:hypothetical protein
MIHITAMAWLKYQSKRVFNRGHLFTILMNAKWYKITASYEYQNGKMCIIHTKTIGIGVGFVKIVKHYIIANTVCYVIYRNRL